MRILRRWDEKFSTSETNEILDTLATWHLSQVRDDSPERERIATSFARRDYRFLCNTNFAYERLNPFDAYHLRQVVAFYKKRDDLDFGVDKEEVAYAKFCVTERLCAETNAIFKAWDCGRFQFRPRVEAVLHGAQRKMSQILGKAPSFEQLKVRFGPGATTQVKKRDACPAEKLERTFCCSEDFLGVLADALEEVPAWSHREGDPEQETTLVTVDIHRGRLDFALKTAEEFRTIVIEPSLNMMFQLGAGDWIKKRLKRFGLDLTDQSVNQRLARVGSLTGALATLDQTSASDCGARGLISHLTPVDWDLLLSRLRTGEVEYKGRTIKLEKFSSNGNGFTFPLETCFFYSIAFAACEIVLGREPRVNEEIACYGDDLIVPTVASDLVMETLHCVGFLPNRRKSFTSGPFRESCGTDWFSGIDIRPAYVDTQLDGLGLFGLHNYYVRTGQDDCAAILRARIHHSVQIFGPDGYGDGHLLGDWVGKPIHRSKPGDPPSWCQTRENMFDIPKDWRSNRHSTGWGGCTFDTYTYLPRRGFLSHRGCITFPVYSIYSNGPTGLSADIRESRPRFWEDILDVPGARYSKQGELAVILPNHRGYKRISIYAMQPY